MSKRRCFGDSDWETPKESQTNKAGGSTRGRSRVQAGSQSTTTEHTTRALESRGKQEQLLGTKTSLQSSCDAKNTTPTQFAGTTTSNTNATQHTVAGEGEKRVATYHGEKRWQPLRNNRKGDRNATFTSRTSKKRQRGEPPFESTPTRPCRFARKGKTLSIDDDDPPYNNNNNVLPKRETECGSNSQRHNIPVANTEQNEGATKPPLEEEEEGLG